MWQVKWSLLRVYYELSGIIQKLLLVFDNILGDSEGLLGVWNDDGTDDLLAANGTTLADSSPQEVIFYEFGESCNICF